MHLYCSGGQADQVSAKHGIDHDRDHDGRAGYNELVNQFTKSNTSSGFCGGRNIFDQQQITKSITIANTMAGLPTWSWSNHQNHAWHAFFGSVEIFWTKPRILTQAQVFVGEENFLTNSKSRNRSRSRTRWQGCLQGVYGGE